MMYITGGQFTDTIDKDVGFLIDKWNEVVKENDTVLYVGNFIYSNEIDLRNIIEQLNGKICILQQNNGVRQLIQKFQYLQFQFIIFQWFT